MLMHVLPTQRTLCVAGHCGPEPWEGAGGILLYHWSLTLKTSRLLYEIFACENVCNYSKISQAFPITITYQGGVANKVLDYTFLFS